MQFILTLIMCSYTSGTCLPPYQWPIVFHDAYSCMIGGSEASIDKYIALGAEKGNTHKMYIKFYCSPEKIGEPS